MRDDMRTKSWRYRELHVMFVSVRAVSRYQYLRLVGYSRSRTWAASREDGVPRPNSSQRQANPKVSLIQYVVLESGCYDIYLFSNFLIWFSRTARFLLGLEANVALAAVLLRPAQVQNVTHLSWEPRVHLGRVAANTFDGLGIGHREEL